MKNIKDIYPFRASIQYQFKVSFLAKKEKYYSNKRWKCEADLNL